MIQIFSFLDRHNWFASRADAYADGELTLSEQLRFESHLDRCDDCSGVVAEARTLRAAMAQLPEVEIPRSFRLTPQMVGQTRGVAGHRRATPVYLGLARAGAALSVAAFAGVLVVSSLQTSSNSSNDSAAQISERDFQYAAPITSEAAAADKAAEPEPTAQLAPATAGGGVSGSALPTPTMVSSNPLIPSTAEVAPPSQGSDDVSRSSASDGGNSELTTIGTAAAASDVSNDGVSPLAIILGIAAATSVVLLAALEVSRRARRA